MKHFEKWTTETNITDEQMLKRWRALISYVASVVCRTYHLDDSDREDLISSISMKVIRMPESKKCFEHYTRVVINNSVRTLIEKIMAKGGSPTARWRDFDTINFSEATTNRDPYSEDTDMDKVIPTPKSGENDLVNKLAVHKMLQQLTDRQREVISLKFGLFGEQLTEDEIANRLKISRTMVNKISVSAMAKLRRINKKGYHAI